MARRPWSRPSLARPVRLALAFGALGASLAARTEAAPVDVEPEQEGDAAEGGEIELLPRIDLRRGGSNYLAVNFADFRDECAAAGTCEQGVMQFRLDVEYHLARLEKWPEIGYFYAFLPARLSGFWDVFDSLPGSESQPFLETIYAPGVELCWVLPWWQHFGALGAAKNDDAQRSIDGHSLTLGVLHESNGLGAVTSTDAAQADYSRAWNRVYARAHAAIFETKRVAFDLDLSAWVPFADEAVAMWPNGETTRSHLREHLGYGEAVLGMRLDFGPWRSFSTRLAARQTSVDFEIRWSFEKAQSWNGLGIRGNGFRFDLIARCYLGRGERLIVANESHQSCYAGFGL